MKYLCILGFVFRRYLMNLFLHLDSPTILPTFSINPKQNVEHISRIYKGEEKPHLNGSLIFTLSHSFHIYLPHIMSVNIFQYLIAFWSLWCLYTKLKPCSILTFSNHSFGLFSCQMLMWHLLYLIPVNIKNFYAYKQFITHKPSIFF